MKNTKCSTSLSGLHHPRSGVQVLGALCISFRFQSSVGPQEMSIQRDVCFPQAACPTSLHRAHTTCPTSCIESRRLTHILHRAHTTCPTAYMYLSSLACCTSFNIKSWFHSYCTWCNSPPPLLSSSSPPSHEPLSHYQDTGTQNIFHHLQGPCAGPLYSTGP